jgi:WD40 repeat protein
VRVVEAEGGRALAEAAGLGARVSALAFSADGQLVAVGTGTGAVSVLRVAGRAEELGGDRAQRPPITAAAVAANGQAFAFGDEAGGVVILGKDGKRAATAALAGRGVRALAFCGDGAGVLAAGCGDGTVRVVDPATGAVVASHAVATSAVISLSWAREKAALAAGSAAGHVAVLGVDED